MIKLTIDIDVVPQKRPGWGGHAYDQTASRRFKAAMKMLMASKLRGVPPIAKDRAVKVELKIYRNFSSAIHGHFGDIDNLVKGIFDSMNGVVWQDDRQVTELHVYKLTAATPRFELEVEEVI